MTKTLMVIAMLTVLFSVWVFIALMIQRGDGQKDNLTQYDIDTQRFQKAINEASDNGGGIIYLPERPKSSMNLIWTKVLIFALITFCLLFSIFFEKNDVSL